MMPRCRYKGLTVAQLMTPTFEIRWPTFERGTAILQLAARQCDWPAPRFEERAMQGG